jgi:uncharacterized membrane protein
MLYFDQRRHHLPDNEIILAAMPLSAELRRASSTEGKAMRFAIHPQFEAQPLRASAFVPGGTNVGLCCFKGFAGWDCFLMFFVIVGVFRAFE